MTVLPETQTVFNKNKKIEVKQYKKYPFLYASKNGDIYSMSSKKFLTVLKKTKNKKNKIRFGVNHIKDFFFPDKHKEKRNHITLSVDRIVASVYIDNPLNYPFIKHKDGDITNNHSNNLKWSWVSDKYYPENIPTFKLEWKSISFCDSYKISERGDILSVDTTDPYFLKPIKRKSGCPNFYLGKIDNHYYLDFLVATTFISNPNNYEYLTHINGNIIDNHYLNLKWTPEPEELNDEQIWKNIPFIKNYKCSNMGQIRSFKNYIPKILKPLLDKEGYETITLSDNNNNINLLVHRIVALTFLENPLKLPEVDHINHKRNDNRVENLRWVTRKENVKNMKKIISKRARRIAKLDDKGNTISVYNSASEAALDMNVSCSSMTACARGENKYCKGFKFIYLDPNPKQYVSKRDEFFKIIKSDELDFLNSNNHFISNYGNFINRDGYLLSGSSLNGYRIYSFRNVLGDEISIGAHRLVSFFFIRGRTSDRCIVNHINENRQDNHYLNLEWCTLSENVKHSIYKQCHPVNQIDFTTKKIINTFESLTAVSKHFKRDVMKSISKVCKKQTEIYLGYGWEYA